jgi:WhiB family redox-sensing transcriptional regulator
VAIYGEGLGRTEARTASDALELFGLRPAWMRDGLCREHSEVNFFPALGEPIEAAKAVCRRCLVRGECLAFALEHEEPDGVWGGLTGQERRALRRLRPAS